MFSLDWKSGGNNHHSAGSFGGYLYKLKRKQKMVLSQWNRRYFSIEGTNLRWYDSEGSSMPSGAVDLTQVTDINEFQSGQNSSSFVIKCSQRNLMLRADNTKEMEKWLRILRQSTSYAQGGDGTSCDFRGTGPPAKAKSVGGNTLADQLDKALDGLNQLQSDEMERNHEAVRIDISNRINANANLEAAAGRTAAPVALPEGGRIIRSSDSEICVGKMHAPLAQHDSRNKNPHSNAQFSSDHEIVVGKSPGQKAPPQAAPDSPGLNTSAISYYGEDDDGADDGVVEFDELPDEEEFRYQERLLAERYGGAGAGEARGKGDHVSAASDTRDHKVNRRHTPPNFSYNAAPKAMGKEDRREDKGYDSK